jgi:hypothetical protein
MNICKRIDSGRGMEEIELRRMNICKCIERGRGRERERAEEDDHL